MIHATCRRRRDTRSIPERLRCVAGFILAPLAICIAGDVAAADRQSIACDAAARAAAERTGVPTWVLRTITRVETGRAHDGVVQPWPWTVNMEGKGHWFKTRAAALRFAQAELARGARSFDVGCFQINHRWHGEAFASIDDMFDPLRNALYAARFLVRLHDETGDWSRAAGAYHSRTEVHARRYSAKFDAISASLPSDPAPRSLAARSEGREENAYPLLQAGVTTGRLGSLTPAGLARAAAILGPLGDSRG
ncbi:transglycosylase SLT domain-containing protein [Roseovarius sp. SCSIO 43702]|nr:transglycosylase SLT domain-containing protein [Roseovarius sp. SCSIO 43702]